MIWVPGDSFSRQNSKIFESWTAQKATEPHSPLNVGHGPPRPEGGGLVFYYYQFLDLNFVQILDLFATASPQGGQP